MKNIAAILMWSVAGLYAVFTFTGVFTEMNSRWVVALVVFVMLALLTVLAVRKGEPFSGNDSGEGVCFPCILTALLTLGFGLRVAAVFHFKAVPLGDASLFWQEICRWCVGDFCYTKSYTAIGFYAGICAIFGKSLLLIGLVNAALGVVQSWLAYKLADGVFGNETAGLVACAITALNPVSIYSCHLVMSEPLFATLMLAFFYALFCCFRSDCASNKVSRAGIVVGVLGALAFYCRGNGLFTMASAGVLLLAMLCRRDLRREAWTKGFGMVIGFLAVAIPVIIVNCVAYGRVVVGSSDDSIWPLLAGSDLSTRGRWDGKNYKRYIDVYKDVTGRDDFSIYRDTHIVAPYIKQEIVRRWKDNPGAEIDLAVEKYRRLWSSGGEWTWGNRTISKEYSDEIRNWHRDFIDVCMRRYKELLCVLSVVAFASLVFMPRASSLTIVAMFIFLLFNIFNHFFCEEKSRYCYPLWVLLPVWASGIAWIRCWFVKRRKCHG